MVCEVKFGAKILSVYSPLKIAGVDSLATNRK